MNGPGEEHRMSLRKNDLEKAVQSLLCPRNYEYILFVQSQIEKDPHYLTSQKQRQAKNVINMVSTAAPSGPSLHVNDALHVLREAVRRLR
jgi:hypothetical protein